MSDEAMYQILSHLDEPKRIIGLTLADCIIGALTIFFLMFSSSGKIVVGLLGIVVRGKVRRLKKGNSPSYLLVLMYWYLPHGFTRLFIKNLPESHKRYWIS